MSIVLKLFAWCLAAAVAFATLGPPGYRPHASILGHDGEHTLAFVLLGLAFGLAYARNRLFTASIAVGLTGLIEILQFWAPGRHARLEDFLVDALAACVGLAATSAFDLIVKRSQRSSGRRQGEARVREVAIRAAKAAIDRALEPKKERLDPP